MNNEIEIQDIYKLSSMQKGMLFHSNFGKNETYLEQSCISIQGYLDVNALEISLNRIIEKYDVLRTIIECKYGTEPLQIVIKDRLTKIYFEDLTTHVKIHNRNEYIENFMVSDRKKGFDLNKDLLLRMSVFKDEEGSYKIVFSFHHIILDGWSWGIIINELFENYRNIKNSLKFIEKDAVPFVNYIKWIEKQDKEDAVNIWKNYLKNFEGKASLPYDSNSNGNDSYVRAEYYSVLDRELSSKITTVVRENKITVSSLFQTVWGFILHRYNNCEDIILGNVVSGRTTEISGVENIVGMLINTIPVRIQYSNNNKLLDIAKKVHNESSILNKYSYLSFSEIMNAAGLKSNTIKNIMAVENYPINFEILAQEYYKETGIKVNDITTFEQTNFDLNILVIPGDEIKIQYIYNGYLYDEKMLNAINNSIVNIMKLNVDNTNIHINDIEVITNEDKERVLNEFNNTFAEYPLKSIKALFEEQVEENSSKIALIYKNEKITYKELNEKANKVAHVLINKGLKSHDIVGIIVGHNVESIIGILGIIKAGGAYLPIDGNYPDNRIKHMIQDGNAKFILNAEYFTSIDFEEKIVNMNNKEILNAEAYNPNLTLENSSLAYIMYSSGSTGIPKGIAVEHRNIIRLVKNTNYIDFNNVSNILNTSTLAFDASTFEIWGALLNGLTLCIADKGTILETDKLHKLILSNNIDTIWLTSSLFNQIAQENIEVFSSIKTLLVGGDIVLPKNVNRVRELNNNITIINGYGPTENTTFSACHQINKNYRSNIPIGIPISNSKVYIFDSLDYLQPIGAIGEIYVGGDGLSRGYIKNEVLTKEKFIENPYVPGERIYKTGDLARWLSNGNIEFIGRKDNQVKIRGFRIELGEIESRILCYEKIKEVVVLDKIDFCDNKYLCAYVISEGMLKNKEINEYLSEYLPEYMIPTRYVYMDKFPLIENGKIDKKALPEPDNIIEIDNEYEAPTNKIEEALVRIWEEVLGIKNIGINNNFFELGGDSIKAIQIAARAQKENMQFEVKDILEALNINSLQKRVEIIKSEISQKVIEGNVPLTPIQHWLMQIDNGIEYFNQAVMLYNKERFDIDAVGKSFEAIISHHDALRMTYKIRQKECIQYNRGIDDRLFDIEIFDFTEVENLEKKIKQEADILQSKIDLENGPLVKLGLFRTNNGDHLLIIIHHLVVDGISWRILFEDLDIAYRQAVAGKKITLQKKTTSFKEWSKKINKYANDEENKKEFEYWMDLEYKIKKIKNIPKDNVIENRFQKDNNEVYVELNQEKTNRLLREINKIYNTNINDILVAGLVMTISDWTKEKEVVISLEGHGREQIIEDIDLSRTIGWFTTIYPVYLKTHGTEDISDCIKETKETLRLIPNKGIGYVIFKYLKNHSNNLKVQPEISFNYLGQFDSDVPKGLEISNMPIGETISPLINSPYALNINCKIQRGSLNIAFGYSNKEYKKETITNVANKYVYNLGEIIEYSLSRTKKEYTPSDFGNSSMNIKELDELLDVLETTK